MSGVELTDSTIVIVGLKGTILTSRDGGNSFTVISRSDRRGLASVAELAPGHVLAVGEAGLGRIHDFSPELSKMKNAS